MSLEENLRERFGDYFHFNLQEKIGFRDNKTVEQLIYEAAYNWLESKRLMPLSRKPDMIEISDLQENIQSNKTKPTEGT